VPGEPARMLLSVRDVSEQVALRQQVTHLTFHDGLTGLPNRAYVEERAREALEPSGDRVAGVIFLDLDGFTAVNDLIGHGAGDLVLAQAARRLRSVVPAQDTVARWGGDEFSVMLENAAGAQEIIELAERLAGVIAGEPFRVAERDLGLTASIGVVMQTMNIRGLADKVGVESLTFKSGKMKDLLNPFRPATEEEKTYVQELIDETYGKFVGIVARERDLDEAALRAGAADGRVVSGKTAVIENLIDATGYFEDLLAKTKQLAGLPVNARVVELQTPFSLAQLFRLFGASPLEKIELNLGPQSAKLEAGKLYYLSEMSLAR